MRAIKDVIPEVLASFQTPVLLKRHQLIKEWPKIVGAQIAAHTQPKLASQGVLVVWVDQSVLAFELNQRYKSLVLKRVQALLGEEEVKSVRFLVGQLR